MPLDSPALPYGLRDIKLTPFLPNGSLGTAVDLPAAQTLNFSEAEEFETLRGDDRDVAIRGRGPKVEWELESGGISLECWRIITGGTLSNTGVTPNQKKSLLKKVTESREYFQIEGQMINDNEGDTKAKIFKAKCTDTLEGEWADGQFFVSSCSGEGIGDENDNLYEITWSETATALTSGVNGLVQIISNATGGTFTLSYDAQTTSALAYDISVPALQTAIGGLSSVGAGNVVVTGGPGNWVVEFVDTLGAQAIDPVTLGVGSLTGGSAAVLVLAAGAAPS